MINMSLSGPDDRLLGTLLDQALARRMTVVAALGRDRNLFPANHPGVLAVGNLPPLPAGAVLAPGRDVPSTTISGGWALVSGSSFAAAHASGLLALLRELDAGGKVHPLRSALVTESVGRIDSCATLLRQTGGNHQACDPTALVHTPE
ncbi:MAG TPA: S8 family serine peptidase [Roseateles sp.]|nr:S8 family serine peptidase [Roseateles sp.]